MSRHIRRIAQLAVAGVIATGVALPATSSAATSCKLSIKRSQSLGPAYVVDGKGNPGYSVRVTSCSNGMRIIRAFHGCRFKRGKTGRCTSKVLGYSCSERRPADLKSPLSFDGDVTCKRGTARVTHHYTQRT